MRKMWITLLSITCILLIKKVDAQAPENWTDKELMQPSQLAQIIQDKKDSIIIISVGPFNTIPNTIRTGMVSEKTGLEKFKEQLSLIKKDTRIVIYCGCCPFIHCPNVRPAIDMLKQQGFTNFYLLNLPDNLRIDWIDKGYPVVKS
jgi:thiosulfate/3-mercaptopyruvate sulfurtransferase